MTGSGSPATDAAPGLVAPVDARSLPWAAAAAIGAYWLASWLLNGLSASAAPLLETTVLGLAAVWLLRRLHPAPFRDWPVDELAVTLAGGLVLAAVVCGLAWPGISGSVHLVLLVPLAEELFFRGALQGVLQRTWGSIPAVLVTTVVFLVLHAPADLTALLQLTLLALACSGVRLLHRGLLAAVLLHVIWNLTAVVLWTSPEVLANPLVLAGGGLALAAIIAGFALLPFEQTAENKT